MRTKLLIAFAIMASFAGLSFTVASDMFGHDCDGGHGCNCPTFETWEWQDVVCHRCRIVEEKKPIKKTVYDYKEVPYCLTKHPKCGRCGNCDDCRECKDIRYKRVLVKKEITCGETCVTKCVPEEFIERKLVKVCRPACQSAVPCPAPVAGPDIPAPVVIGDAK